MFEQDLQNGQGKQYEFAQAGCHFAKNHVYNFEV